MTLALRFGLVLLVGGFVAAGQADDKHHQDGATGNDKSIPTRVIPPKAQPAKQTPKPVLKPSRPARRSAPRVTVRHLYDTPQNIMLRSDLNTFYLPHTTYPTVDPGTAEWALEAAYLARNDRDRKNLLELYRFREANERQDRLTSKHEQALTTGVEALRSGDYTAAVGALTLAGELDESDPVCRIHLAQARLALGHYEDAAASLRRAIELQPKLIYLDLRLWTYYHEEGELNKHVAALEQWLHKTPASADAYFMYGYLSYQLGQRDDAQAALQRVAHARPHDTLTRELLSVAKPAGN